MPASVPPLPLLLHVLSATTFRPTTRIPSFVELLVEVQPTMRLLVLPNMPMPLLRRATQSFTRELLETSIPPVPFSDAMHSVIEPPTTVWMPRLPLENARHLCTSPLSSILIPYPPLSSTEQPMTFTLSPPPMPADPFSSAMQSLTIALAPALIPTSPLLVSRKRSKWLSVAELALTPLAQA